MLPTSGVLSLDCGPLLAHGLFRIGPREWLTGIRARMQLNVRKQWAGRQSLNLSCVHIHWPAACTVPLSPHPSQATKLKWDLCENKMLYKMTCKFTTKFE